MIQCACGIDIYLKVVVATVDGAGFPHEPHSFKTSTSSLNELKEWFMSRSFFRQQRECG
ncbi:MULTISPECIES: hypothetical protein [Bacteroides]|uniref:hypothetical protein n=1 Tax=Bacteroides TaxID=816 RepID=UPI000A4ABEDF|nr:MULTISPECIES: hypothetical protein [Bacteroides]MCM1761961.1 hypothetical protein [Bacteroides uniformis]